MNDDGSDRQASEDEDRERDGSGPIALVHAVARLSRASTGDFAADTMLRELCESAGAALQVDSVGVMGIGMGISGENGAPSRGRFVHATTGTGTGMSTEEPERLQEALQQGPCRDAMDSGQPVIISDLREQRGRWNEYTSSALEAQMLAVVALPLRSRGKSWGSLDLYRRQAGPWDGATLDLAALLADVAVSYLVMAHDRDQAKESRRELEHRSMHDQLTGLPNRGLLYDRIEHALLTARRRHSTIAVMFIDFDRFKGINDTFGHGAGDRVLIEVTARMATTLRSGDTLGRLAGDEFVLLCENLPDDPAQLHLTLSLITSRLREALAQPVRVDGVDLLVSASIGVTTARDAPDADTLLHDADTAMYAAKDAGRSRVVIRDHVFGDVHGFGRRLERDLLHAVERDQLRLHYQPIFNAVTGRIEAVEALLRWQHPDYDLLEAVDFIDRVESSTASPGISRWVLHAACLQLASWRAELGSAAPDRVFCNLHPRDLIDPTTSNVLAANLATHDLQPGMSVWRFSRTPSPTHCYCPPSVGTPPQVIPWPSTTSAPATPPCPAWSGCRWTTPRSTAASSPACRRTRVHGRWSMPSWWWPRGWGCGSSVKGSRPRSSGPTSPGPGWTCCRATTSPVRNPRTPSAPSSKHRPHHDTGRCDSW